jgi:TatD DNase family protein
MPSMTAFADDALNDNICILAVTTTPKAYTKEIGMLQSFSNIRIALGLHPQLVSKRYAELTLVEKYITKAGYIGEVGLDFNKHFVESKGKQIDVFDNIINWCGKQSNKIISIHSVHADKEVLDILERHSCVEHNRCILHWFSGTLQQLQRGVEMGCLFSVNSAMLKSSNGQKLISNIPSKNILIESDAPFVQEINSAKRLRNELIIISVKLATFFDDSLLTDIQNRSAELLAI